MTLRSVVVQPRSRGPHPLVLIPSPWGGNALYGMQVAARLAERGYVAISYSERGFGGSTGRVEVAGSGDVADLSAVIDWALGATTADPERIGVVGTSYGGGVSLLGAAADPRIDAVAALSGWSGLLSSLILGDTRARMVGLALYRSGISNGSLTADADRMLRGFIDPGLVPEEELMRWAQERSPIGVVDRINDNGTAVLLGQAWSETVFPPGPLLDLFDALSGPKRIELQPGDHASVEVPGLLGLGSVIWDSVYHWFDAHVAGTGPGPRQGVVIRPRPGPERAEEHYPDRASATLPARKLHLGGGNDGVLAARPAAGPAHTIDLGRDTMAAVGVPLATYSLEALTGDPPTTLLPLVDRSAAGVWHGSAAMTTTRLRGAPRLSLDVVPSAGQGTLVAYLMAVDGNGVGRMIGHAPASWEGATAGARRTVEFRFQPTAYDFPAGDRITLVVDGQDLLYADLNNRSGSIAFPAGSPGSLALPVSP
ncbi:CocE/NonD family hydrolase [Streptomyces sp. NPDC003006]